MNNDTANKAFSFERVALLSRNRLLEDFAPFLIAIGALAGLNILSLLLGGSAFFNRPDGHSGQTAWPFLIWLGGILLAGRAFSQMHNGRGGSDWILLPATPFEKYAAAFASYLIVYPVLAALAAFGLSAVLEGLAIVLKAYRGVVFNPLAGLDEGSVFGYLFFVTAALAASARFAKLSLVKAGALFTAWGAFMAFLFVFGLMVMTPEGREAMANHRFSQHFEPDFVPASQPALIWIGRAWAWVSCAAAAVYGYFRVAEKEAIDEVQ